MRENLKNRYKNKSTLPKILAAGMVIITIAPLMMLLFEEENVYIKVFGYVVSVAVGIIFFVLLGQDQYEHQLKKYAITEEELDYDYQHADEVVANTYFFGKKYMIALIYAGIMLYKLDDIVWVYKDVYTDKTGKKNDYLVLHTIDKKKHALPPAHDDTEADKLLYYFSQKCPHVVVGSSKETKRMFKNEFDRFLQIKYYPGLQKEREQD